MNKPPLILQNLHPDRPLGYFADKEKPILFTLNFTFMKTRLFTLLFTFLGAIGLFAQADNSIFDDPGRWQAPDPGMYHSSLIVIGQLGYTADGNRIVSEPNRGDKLAAFIGNECRGVYYFSGTHTVGQKGDVGYEVAQLRIWGSTADANQPLVFKYSAGGSVYTLVPDQKNLPQSLTPPLTFPGEDITYGNLAKPIQFFYSAPIQDITLSLSDLGEKALTMRVGESIDLTQKLKITISPAGAKMPENAYWSSGQHYNIDGNILTAISETGEMPETLYLIYGLDKMATYEPLHILPALVNVSGIELISNNQVYVNRDDQFDIIYNVEPYDASNKAVTFKCSTPGAIEIGEPLEVDQGFKVTCVAKTKGPHSVTITTVDGNFSVTVDVTVRVPIKSAKFKEAEATYYVGEKYPLPEIVLDPVDADFEPYAIKARIYQNPDYPAKPDLSNTQWRLAEDLYEMDQFHFIPAVIGEDIYIEAYVGGEIPCIQKMTFKKRYSYGQGWSWASVPYQYNFMVMEDPIKGLQEVRSEDYVAFNDPQFGWFGDNFKMEQGNAYKQNVGSGIFREIGYVTPREEMAPIMKLRKGWNWVGNPYEYDFIVDLLFKNIGAQEGDIILSKNNGMMTYTANGWQSSTQSLFPLRTGEGYLYYAQNANSQIYWGKQFEMPQPRPEQMSTLSVKNKTEQNLWKYDGSRFASSMAIIGKMNIAPIGDVAQYSIGAFVGNECRGEGRILENGMVLVSLNGETGENVTFKLCDKITGEILDFATEVNFDILAGELSHPIPFLLDMDATGIDNISGENLNIHFVGNELQVDGGFPYQIVAADGKIVTGQQLPRGVYIVVVDTPEGKVSQKVVKK